MASVSFKMNDDPGEGAAWLRAGCGTTRLPLAPLPPGSDSAHAPLSLLFSRGGGLRRLARRLNVKMSEKHLRRPVPGTKHDAVKHRHCHNHAGSGATRMTEASPRYADSQPRNMGAAWAPGSHGCEWTAQSTPALPAGGRDREHVLAQRAGSARCFWAAPSDEPFPGCVRRYRCQQDGSKARAMGTAALSLHRFPKCP